MKTIILFGFIGSAALLGCGNDSSSEYFGPRGGPGGPDNTSGGTSGDNGTGGRTLKPRVCAAGKSYATFGGGKLEADRVDAPAGADRMRVKPYSALQGDYPRVLAGANPPLLANAGATFGVQPDRWSSEPQSNAVSVYTSYRIAFEGCLTYTASAPEYAAAPTAATAQTACATMARTFWSRTANPEELAACVDMATTGSSKETDPRRRWAYSCASVLSAAGFLTY